MKNKRENLKNMGTGELKKHLAQLEENVRVIKFKAQGARSKNVKELVNLKKQVARVLTEINSK